MTDYYAIRSDPQHSKCRPLAEVLAAIAACSPHTTIHLDEVALIVDGKHLWCVPAAASANGSYNTTGGLPPLVNLIDIRCRSAEWPDEAAVIAALRPLCERLGWELTNHDDEVLIAARR